jgi:hypothetical protein
MKKVILATVLTIVSMMSLYATDTLSLNAFNFLQGNWKGTLTYTDYQDDTKQVQLNTFNSFVMRQDGIDENTTYIEPNGIPVYDQSFIKITKKGQVKWGNMLFTVSEKTENSLVLITEHMDNNKEATIKETISHTGDQLSITKEVRYKGTAAFFKRNSSQFTKEKDSDVEARLWQSLKGIWQIDLRPSPEAAPYFKDFELTNFIDGKLSGIFYGTPFDNGKIHTALGKIYFSFTTQDQTNTYFHSGSIEKGKIQGQSFSPERGFVMPWHGVKK